MLMAQEFSQKPPPALLLKEPGLRIVRLRGLPGEMGHAHGRMLGREIRQMRGRVLNYLAKITGWVGGLPLYLALMVLARRFRPYIPGPYWEEMQGVAAGAGVSINLILLLNVFDDLVQNLPRCSGLAAESKDRHTSSWLLARNLDYAIFTEVMARLQTVFLLHTASGIPLVSVAWPGFVGLYTGMNQKRVALAQLSAMTVDRTIGGCPAGIRNRQALQQGQNLQQVAVLITASKRTSGNNLVLCSPAEAQVLEVSARHWQIRRASHGLIIATNHYQSAKMQAVKGQFPPRPPFSPLSPWHFTEAYSHSRQRRLHALAANGIDMQKARNLLADPEVANPGTVSSVIFQPQTMAMCLAQSLITPVAAGRWWRLTDLFADLGPERELISV
ncbi:MAG: C45 family autoproteolytic acyltransferase/hydrolase [Desulfobacteraceae bacterium]